MQPSTVERICKANCWRITHSVNCQVMLNLILAEWMLEQIWCIVSVPGLTSFTLYRFPCRAYPKGEVVIAYCLGQHIIGGQGAIIVTLIAAHLSQLVKGACSSPPGTAENISGYPLTCCIHTCTWVPQWVSDWAIDALKDSLVNDWLLYCSSMSAWSLVSTYGLTSEILLSEQTRQWFMHMHAYSFKLYMYGSTYVMYVHMH